MYEVQKQSDTFWLAALHKPTETPLRRRGGSDPLVSRTNNSCSSPSESVCVVVHRLCCLFWRLSPWFFWLLFSSICLYFPPALLLSIIVDLLIS